MTAYIRNAAGSSGRPERIVFSLSLLYLFVLPWQASIPFFEGDKIVGVTLAFLLAGAWFLLVLYRRTVRRPHIFHIMFAVFTGLHVLSILWSVDFSRTILSIPFFIMVGSMMYIYWDLYDTRSAVEYGLQALLLGIFVTAVLVLIAYITASGDINRRNFGFTGFNATEISRIFVFGLPITVFLYYSADQFQPVPWKLINAGYIPIGVAAIIVTGSRQSFVILILLIIIIFFIILYHWRTIYKQYPKTISLICASVVLGVYTFPRFSDLAIFERFFTTTTVIQNGTLNNRTNIWEAGLAVINNRPWVGAGSGTFPSIIEPALTSNGIDVETLPPDIYPHNVFLGTAAEIGFIGLSFLLLSLLIIIYEISTEREFILFTSIIILIWIALSLVADLHLYAISWMVLAMLLPLLALTSEPQYWRLQK